jgi:acetylornithine deacetylase
LTLFELTKKLINIPSITEEEGQLAYFLSSYFKDSGFQVLQQEIGSTRMNILATMHQKPRIILNTHLDTVPPFIPAKEDETHIYGRGACDAKGIMAAMIFALLNLKKKGVKEVGLLLVVGEETDSIGAKNASHLNVGSDYIIVGEPTSNTLGKGHPGLITLKLQAKGKAAHSALPHLGESAIDKLIDALYKIRQLDLGTSELGQNTVNTGRIEGGVAHNVIADSASSVISIRNSVPSEIILKKITNSINNLVEIDVLTQSEPQFTYTIPDMEQTILPFSTDIPHLKNFGKPLLIGPGSAEVAHTADEKIEKNQLNQAVEIYQNLIITLLN